MPWDTAHHDETYSTSKHLYGTQACFATDEIKGGAVLLAT